LKLILCSHIFGRRYWA